ncbi:MAG TPA: lipocalin-like domain-containing protein [Stellaceae bacterium]|nr:lipocalin-like domain-containing protein [Stellaceae bacterium]
MSDYREQIVGTWALESAVYEDEATGERGHPLGLHPGGCQIATREGRWIAVVTAQSRPVPQDDAERAAALRSMIAYTGRYRVEDDRVVTKVEAAWNEAWVGTEQVRIMRFEGERLHLEGPPQPHPNLAGRRVRIIITWRREA